MNRPPTRSPAIQPPSSSAASTSISVAPSTSGQSTSLAPFLNPGKRSASSEYRARRHSEIVSDLDRIQQEKFDGNIELGLLKDGRSKHPSKIADVRVRKWSRGKLTPLIGSEELPEEEEEDEKQDRTVEKSGGGKSRESPSGFIAGEELEKVRKELLEEKTELEMGELARRFSGSDIPPERPQFSQQELSPLPIESESESDLSHSSSKHDADADPDSEAIKSVKISIVDQRPSSGTTQHHHTSEGLGLSGVPSSVIFTPTTAAATESTPAATTTPTSTPIVKTAFHNAQAEAGKGIKLTQPPTKKSESRKQQ